MSDGVRIEHLSKTFGGTRVLKDVSLEFRFGGIHGVVGENGAGKSTLFKLLAGYHEPDPGGRLTVAGEEHALPLTPSSSAGLGFAFVHQDLGLAESMSIMENVCVGAMLTTRFGRVRWRAQARMVEQLMAGFGVRLPADTPIEQLSQAERAVVAVARGVYARGRERARMLVLDEPTANFSPPERDRLFEAMRRAAAAGTAIVFCTHRLDEILEITDQVTVLRDGAIVREVATGELTGEEDLVRSILGRELSSFYPDRTQQEGGEVVLDVQGLSGRIVKDLSFQVRAGEVVGITGLAGAGQDSVPHLVIGDEKPAAGTVAIDGRTLERPTPRRAVQRGIGFLPANRKRDSGVLEATLRENLTLVSLGRYVRGGRLRIADERGAALETFERYDVRPRGDCERALGSLSGGNQQKVLMAKWLSRKELRCMILHEPTQGVDVGAKQFILERVAELAARGVGVVLVSSEPAELASLCDRVLVLRDGALSADLAQPTPEAISEQCFLSRAR
jgi:ribose transport system ATP-binding protein